MMTEEQEIIKEEAEAVLRILEREDLSATRIFKHVAASMKHILETLERMNNNDE